MFQYYDDAVVQYYNITSLLYDTLTILQYYKVHYYDIAKSGTILGYYDYRQPYT